MKPLNELEYATSPDDIGVVYLQNMQICGVCQLRYEALIEAIKSRQGGKQ